MGCAVDDEKGGDFVACEIDMSSVRRGRDRSYSATGKRNSFDDRLRFYINDENEVRKDLSDEQLATPHRRCCRVDVVALSSFHR